MNNLSKSDSYAAAGVDITAGYKAVELMKTHIARTMTSGVCSDVGGFGGLFELDVQGMEKPVLVSGTDGVGTKLKLAFLQDKHDTVGIDCVAMCVNDVICCGAKPLFFLDYIACGRNNTLGVSLTGAFLYSRAVIPGMVSRKRGRIINITSIWGIVGSSCEVHYSAAKAGLIGFTKALAKELGPSGITVNAIAPGLIDTEMNGSLSDDDKKAIIEETPVMRIGNVNDVARAAFFIAQDESSFITGDVLNISGGFIV